MITKLTGARQNMKQKFGPRYDIRNIVTLHKTFHQENEICIVMDRVNRRKNAI